MQENCGNSDGCLTVANVSTVKKRSNLEDRYFEVRTAHTTIKHETVTNWLTFDFQWLIAGTQKQWDNGLP